MRIEFLMFEGVAEMDILLPYDVFGKAKLNGADVEPVFVTADGRTEVTGCYGTRFAGLRRWDPPTADVLVVAGGWIDEILDEGVIQKQLRDAKHDNLILGGVDSGSLLFGAAGLLQGRAATTYRPDHQRLAEYGAEVIDARIVDDGDIVTTSSGWLTGLDLALYLIERELGLAKLAIDLERAIGHDRRGTVWRRSA